MDIFQFLEAKRLWSEGNAEDQRNLSNAESATFWRGRALSYQEIAGALRSGIVTQDGILKLDLSSVESGEASDG